MQREGYYKQGFPEGLWTYWNVKCEKDFEFDFGENLEHIVLEDLSNRDGLFYKLDENKPFTGVITQENPDAGYQFLGRTKDGKKDGMWVKWFQSGKEVPEVVLVDVQEPEPDVPWSGNKQEQGAFKDGEKHGLWTEWYDNEHVKSHGTYDMGIMNGEWAFYYTNGIKEKEGTLSNGNAHGLWKFWDEEARKAQEGAFENGIKNGKWIAWLEDGHITEGHYKNGKKDAMWTSWWDTEKNRKEMRGNYKDGKMVDKWFFYDKEGNLKEIRYFSPTFK